MVVPYRRDGCERQGVRIQPLCRVRVARRQRDLSQQELADAVGITRQTIGLIEAKKYNPSIRICLMITALTGWSLDDLFRFNHPKNVEYDSNRYPDPPSSSSSTSASAASRCSGRSNTSPPIEAAAPLR